MERGERFEFGTVDEVLVDGLNVLLGNEHLGTMVSLLLGDDWWGSTIFVEVFWMDYS